MRGTAHSIVGRDEEIRILESTIGAARTGGARVAILSGEAGIGKSRLIDELSERATGMGFWVARGKAEELEFDRPFGAIADALGLQPSASDSERARIGRLVVGRDIEPEDAPPGPGLRYRIVEDILELVEGLLREGPLLVALDDLHWADPSTLLVVHHVARRLRDAAIAFLLAHRHAPRPPELDQLIESAGAARTIRLRLEPLDSRATAELVEQAAGGTPGPRLLDQIRRAGGNPFFILELLDALLQERAIQTSGGMAEVTSMAIPISMRLTTLRKIGFLPATTLELLRLAAILGPSFSVSELAAVSARTPVELLPDLDQALTAGVLMDAGEELAFRHDLIRESIYADLSDSVRTALHLQAGRALVLAAAPPLRVAAQMSRGASVGDGEAVRWLRLAADEAVSRAPPVGATLYGRALELADRDDPSRPELLLGQVRALLWSGRWLEAEGLSRDLLKQTMDDEMAGELLYALGRALVYQGRLGDSISAVELGLSRPGLSVRHRSRLLADLSLRRPVAGDLEGAESAAHEALELGARVGDRMAVSTARSGLSWTAGHRGDVEKAIREARAAIPDAGAPGGEPVEGLQPRYYLAFALIEGDEFTEARHVLEEARSRAEEMGVA